MKSKEIIKRIIEHRNPPRIGFNFINPNYNDISYVSGRTYIEEKPNPYKNWGKHQELLDITGFSGEVKTDPSYEDIGIKFKWAKWAKWAEDIIVNNAVI